MAPLHAIAPAKLNLALHITGKREDGYHLLESLVAFAQDGDHVTLEDAEEFSLDVTGPFAAGAGDLRQNLVFRAAHALSGALGEKPRGHIRLEKRIPVGAGLGGGSADAVVACRLLLRYWGHIMPDAELAALLLPLGADMPMCVAGRPLIAFGIGDVIMPLAAFPRMYAVMCWPNISLPTADVYRAYRYDGRSLPSLISLADFNGDWQAFLEQTRNVLQFPAVTLAPEVAELLLAMETHLTRPFVRMSGSGACCVGYLETESAANQLAAALRSSYPAWWVQVTVIGG